MRIMRELTGSERHAIATLAAELRSDKERDQLRTDITHCTVAQDNDGWIVLTFNLPGSERPPGKQSPYRAKDSFARRSMRDADVAEIFNLSSRRKP
jgi:hypothetical protein